MAQETPKTPKTSTSKSSSYSISIDTDDDKSNSSVSIKRNNDVYKFTARFHENKKSKLKKLLIDKLGKSNLSVVGDSYRWVKNENGQKLYDCKLTDTTLKIYVDKEFSNSKIVNMMDNFGGILKDAISGTDHKKREKEEEKRELKRAEREFARAKRELQRIKRKLSKNK